MATTLPTAIDEKSVYRIKGLSVMLIVYKYL